jgi:hypothetical protein
VSGFGGTLNLILGLLFVVAVLAVQAVPCFLYYGKGWFTAATFRWVVAGSMTAIAALSLAACLIPFALGLRSLKRLEL